jgi:exopolysaccharide biosynthesis polyprenyl glycosylphosphotransferase
VATNRISAAADLDVRVRQLTVPPLIQHDRSERRTVHVAELCFALFDVSLVCVNGALAFYTRFFYLQHSHSAYPLVASAESYAFSQHLGFFLLYSVLAVLTCESQDLYRAVQLRSAFEEGFAILKALFLATLMLTVFIYLSGSITISRFVIGSAAMLNAITFLSWRAVRRAYMRHRLAQGYGTRNVLIVGAGEVGQALARHFQQNISRMGLVVRGFLDVASNASANILGSPEDLSRIARAEFIDDVFITVPSDRELVKEVVAQAREQRLNVHVIPDLYDGLAWGAGLAFVGDFPVLELQAESIPEVGLLAKRSLDIIGSILGLIVLSPLFAVIALAIRIDSKGSILHRSRRVGSKGRLFTCLKFRTMVDNAEQLQDKLAHLNQRSAVLFKIPNDPRVTPLGRFLRKYSLDELPQLWNVLKGDMSLVGPRPPLVTEVERYNLEHLRRLDITPGITGLWQITARRDPSFASYMTLDLEYIENWSLWMDLRILLLTVFVVLKGTGQ